MQILRVAEAALEVFCKAWFPALAMTFISPWMVKFNRLRIIARNSSLDYFHQLNKFSEAV